MRRTKSAAALHLSFDFWRFSCRLSALSGPEFQEFMLIYLSKAGSEASHRIEHRLDVLWANDQTRLSFVEVFL